MNHRTAYFISDRTGITAETLGLSLISQFDHIYFTQVTLPFIDSKLKALEAKKRIESPNKNDEGRPIIFATIINNEVRDIIKGCDAYFLDFFKTFIGPLEAELQSASSKTIGRVHGVFDLGEYNTRIESVNFALNFDDGGRVSGYEQADVILIGVSRSGKTPTSLYLAMQYGIQAANYPLTERDLNQTEIPAILQPHRNKLFGLTIDPVRLQAIRAQRRPNSKYAQLAQCQRETRQIEALFKQENIPFLSATNLSIEELATKLMDIVGLRRRLR